MNTLIRVAAIHPKFSRLYTITNDPYQYYDYVIGSDSCNRISGWNWKLDTLGIELFAGETLAFEYFEYLPSNDDITQKQRDKWWKFRSETKVTIL